MRTKIDHPDNVLYTFGFVTEISGNDIHDSWFSR
jgi:hypothetical protein